MNTDMFIWGSMALMSVVCIVVLGGIAHFKGLTPAYGILGLFGVAGLIVGFILLASKPDAPEPKGF